MGLIEFLVVLLVIGWLLGFAFAGVGELIHILLILAIIIVLYRLLTGAYRRGGDGL